MMPLLQAVRRLSNDSGYALGVVGSLALAMSANIAVVSVVRSAWLRRLPFAHATQLFQVRRVSAQGNGLGAVGIDIASWQARSRSIQSMSKVAPGIALLTKDANLESALPAASAEANFLKVLGVRPELGRWFSPDEERAGDPDRMVPSDEVWRSRFSGDSSAIGRPVILGRCHCTVIGVLRRGIARYSMRRTGHRPIRRESRMK